MTVLDGVNAGDVSGDPFPHLVVENAAPGLCQRLIDEFPPLSLFTRGRKVGDNVKLYCPSRRAFSNDHVSDIWKAFLEEHLTPEFYAQFVRVFRTHLLAEYPDVEREYGRALDSLRVGVEGQDDFSQCDLLMDALIGVHTPVLGLPRLERRPHVKTHDKFLEGFLYLRPADDDAEGGDYELFSINPGHDPTFGKWAQTERHHLKLERTISYGKGTLVVILNSPRSIQALTPRGPGRHPLMYANFTLRASHRLFDLNYRAFGRTHRFVRGLYDRVNSSLMES